MATRRRWGGLSDARVLPSGVVLLFVLAGCSPAGQGKAAVGVATRFVTAVSRHDGSAACDLLSARARSSASGATDTPCPQAVLNVKENGTQVRGVQIWSDRAQVRIGGDVLFLERFNAGWRVNAAGCKPDPPKPYECDVEG
ncbi:MAG: hypothetical protein M3Y44_10510 [Actinomycetota bacterium]|nr:hypothetical protein [Actinomycetota bacterium]